MVQFISKIQHNQQVTEWVAYVGAGLTWVLELYKKITEKKKNERNGRRRRAQESRRGRKGKKKLKVPKLVFLFSICDFLPLDDDYWQLIDYKFCDHRIKTLQKHIPFIDHNTDFL